MSDAHAHFSSRMKMPCTLWSTTLQRYMLGQRILLYMLTSLCRMKERCQLHAVACSALIPI